jgi:hypothetical protein
MPLRRTRVLHRLRLFGSFAFLALGAACSMSGVVRGPEGSPTLKRIGLFKYNSSRDPQELGVVAVDRLTRMRMKALGDAAAVIDHSTSWQAAQPAIQRLYAQPKYRSDYAAQQLIALAYVRGMLMPAPASPERDAALLRHVSRLVANGGIDSVAVYTGLAPLASGANGRAVADLQRRAGESIAENRRLELVCPIRREKIEAAQRRASAEV